jgi:hypothetical protein
MTTHPPGGPSGPTGPGRSPDEREQWLDANADRLPTLAEVLADADRLIAQTLAMLDRQIDPTTYPTGHRGHVADAGFELAGFHLAATQAALASVAAQSRAKAAA